MDPFALGKSKRASLTEEVHHHVERNIKSHHIQDDAEMVYMSMINKNSKNTGFHF
jgi:hypothetical protein